MCQGAEPRQLRPEKGRSQVKGPPAAMTPSGPAFKQGLAYAARIQSPVHLRTTFFRPELAGLSPPDTIKEKAEMLVDYEDRPPVDALIFCRFYRDLYPWRGA